VPAEILEERVAGNRGRRVPRGVKRKMSGYPLRPRAPQPTVLVDFAAAVRILRRTRATLMVELTVSGSPRRLLALI
jgi:hypothetical protein